MAFEEIILETLKQIPNDLWDKLALIGSVNMYLQGVAVTPKKDVDIATDYATIQKLAKLFTGKTTDYCDAREGNNTLPFSYLFIKQNDFEVEFFDATNSGQSYYLGVIKQENLVTLPGVPIKALNLKTEMRVCEKAGKLEKVNAIKLFLMDKDKRVVSRN
jgi:hypothetical protein